MRIVSSPDGGLVLADDDQHLQVVLQKGVAQSARDTGCVHYNFVSPDALVCERRERSKELTIEVQRTDQEKRTFTAPVEIDSRVCWHEDCHFFGGLLPGDVPVALINLREAPLPCAAYSVSDGGLQLLWSDPLATNNSACIYAFKNAQIPDLRLVDEGVLYDAHRH